MKTVRAFLTVDQYIDNTTDIVSPVFELSDYAMTFSKVKKQYYYSKNTSYSLYLFNTKETDSLTQEEVDNIVTSVNYLNQFLNQNVTYDKQILLNMVVEYLNTALSNDIVNSINYSSVVSGVSVKAADYITINTAKLDVSVWCAYAEFETFYPEYEIVNVLPFDNFATAIQNQATTINTLNTFDLTQFNIKIQNSISKKPPTAVKIINIPYTIQSTGVKTNCYFGFIIYGAQGDYDYILKLQLYEYLKNTLNIPQSQIDGYFPDMLKINEFFIVPRWDMVAISSQVGEYGINTQITKTYIQDFDTNQYLPVYNNNDYLKSSTYNVPFDYNNILLQITNGYYSTPEIQDFKEYYSDFISVNSTDTDFARMSTKTQNFVTLLYTMLYVADSTSQIEFISRIIEKRQYALSSITRSGVTYLSYLYDKHQYYVIPRFEMDRIKSGG